MTTQEVKRKLAAILSADVKGYSRLMGADEEGTLHTLTAYREAMATFIQQHQGRVINVPGDALLAQFESVVDALKSAVEIQRELAKRNAGLPADRKMEYRIGINLGDVMVDGEAIYGDGVNIAARLENLADAGGICISGTVFDQIKNKLNLGYEFRGEQTVKNIAEPVRVYKVLMEPEVAGKVIGEKKAKPRKWQSVGIGLVVAVIVAVAAVAVWRLYLRPTPPPREVASKEKMAFPLPDVPSIAVLPFTNMSADPKEEYFSDGMTEEIITALSKVPHLFVIARNSTFTYKGKAVKVKQVSEELGVRYVLEGSIRKAENKVRITAQLIDALSGHYLWADRYDRDLKEIFALQDEITMKIVTAMQVKLTTGEVATLWAKGTKNLEAYLMVLQAHELLLRFNNDDNALALRKCEEAICMDPGYPRAHAILSTIYVINMVFGVSPKESMEKALMAAKKAVALNDTDASVHVALEFVHSWKRQHAEALRESQRAVELEPGSAESWFSLGRALDYACKHEDAIESLKKAIRMNPFPKAVYFFHLGNAYLNVGKYEEAIAEYKKVIKLSPTNAFPYRGLAVSYAYLGSIEEARDAAQEILKRDPKFSLQKYPELAPWKEQATVERWLIGLRKAGLK